MEILDKRRTCLPHVSLFADKRFDAVAKVIACSKRDHSIDGSLNGCVCGIHENFIGIELVVEMSDLSCLSCLFPAEDALPGDQGRRKKTKDNLSEIKDAQQHARMVLDHWADGLLRIVLSVQSATFDEAEMLQNENMISIWRKLADSSWKFKYLLALMYLERGDLEKWKSCVEAVKRPKLPSPTTDGYPDLLHSPEWMGKVLEDIYKSELQVNKRNNEQGLAWARLPIDISNSITSNELVPYGKMLVTDDAKAVLEIASPLLDSAQFIRKYGLGPRCLMCFEPQDSTVHSGRTWWGSPICQHFFSCQNCVDLSREDASTIICPIGNGSCQPITPNMWQSAVFYEGDHAVDWFEALRGAAGDNLESLATKLKPIRD